MPNKHYLAHGGLPKQRAALAAPILPSVPFGPTDPTGFDDRRNGIDYALSRYFNFDCGPSSSPCLGCVTPDCVGSADLREYLSTNSIAVGDEIVTNYLPNMSTLRELFIQIEKPITPFTFDIVLANHAYATPGVFAAPIVLATDYNGSVAGWDVLDIIDINGGSPIKIDLASAEIRLVVKTLPAPAAPVDNCTTCMNCGGLCGLRLIVSPVVRRYLTGSD
jgi:hypothetical protein